ncbi:dephospho-CoA kinase [[Clostridium] polysaccharolyticum]|uniref:Dephospho-CoA kinase n=1 Tax=[Clostridium] polysaccharolyticum TaxID=29364 RepID=A0A1I0AYF6_9FIRM|nr:dephospho-CoA kinase [[Clostridium] polysaccharolyticum]SES99443.1 dephospho-CoA kinase [[Clostridium] polysaccharolyticum]
MKVIGLTGGVGCGKSTVANIIKENFQASVLIADDIGAMLMQPGQSCYKEIVAAFGEKAVLENGQLDRKGIAAMVFADDVQLSVLNGIIHPKVKEYIKKEVLKIQNEKLHQYVFIESAIILECGYEDVCDEFWYVSAPYEERVRRLKVSRGYSDAKIQAIMSNQKEEKQFQQLCSVVLENDGDLEKIYSQLKILLV